MKAVVAAFNQEKALVGAFSVITNLRMDLSLKVVGSGLVSCGGQHRVESDIWTQMDADKHAAFMGRLTFGARRKQSWKDIQGVSITAAIHPLKKTKI